VCSSKIQKDRIEGRVSEVWWSIRRLREEAPRPGQLSFSPDLVVLGGK
jgi:hypothetical protein